MHQTPSKPTIKLVILTAFSASPLTLIGARVNPSDNTYRACSLEIWIGDGEQAKRFAHNWAIQSGHPTTYAAGGPGWWRVNTPVKGVPKREQCPCPWYKQEMTVGEGIAKLTIAASMKAWA